MITLRYGRGMSDEELMLAKSADTLRAYEERAKRELAAAARVDKPELASAHRLLALQYEADAHELRRQIAANI